MLALQAKRQPEPVVYVPLLGEGDSTGLMGEERTVQGDDLRDVNHGFSREPALTLGEMDVARCVGKTKVRCDDCSDDRADVALIEGIRLDDENRTTIARLRSRGRGKGGPPNLASLDYHFSAGTDLAWARCQASSKVESAASA